MDDITTAILLGIVQGLTEFLPVSSSGHLEVAKFVLSDDQVAKKSMLMTVVLHFATALSTIVVFREEVRRIIRGLLQFNANEEFYFCLKIVVSMIPAAVVGVVFEDEIEQLFDKNMLLVGSMLVVTGVLLYFADQAKTTDKDVGYLDALIIGIAQAVAILPGISRSGATISTTVLLGVDRERAARFSFLMVVPLIFGKMAKDVLDHTLGGETTVSPGDAMPLLLGFVSAFVTGWLACTWMIRLVKSSQLYYFSIYCFAIAVWAMAKGYGVI